MNISLTPELEQLIKQKVESGMYHSASEVVRDALRLLEEREELRQAKLESLRKAIAEGDASLAADGPLPFDAEKIKRDGREALKNGRDR